MNNTRALLYQINTRALLWELSPHPGRAITLGQIPHSFWSQLKNRGVDYLWMMGMWTPSPLGRRTKALEAGLTKEYDRALPDWTPSDVSGSPYAIFDYSVSPDIGSEEELRELHSVLNSLGMRLILDFVPNHTAFDHPWTHEQLHLYLKATEEQLTNQQELFYLAKEHPPIWIAHGKDPYFPPWTDTAQLNYFSQSTREKMIGLLQSISGLCDGVRCDMAMLCLNRVFSDNWGWLFPKEEKNMPKAEFWKIAIQAVKKVRSSFIFIAEAYWNTEWELQQLGFDFTYDKRLYDRLQGESAVEIRKHLQADLEYQTKLFRFIENHDQSRAVSVFGLEKSLAAAVVCSTIPGLVLHQHGQWTGRKVKLPVQLRRAPDEPISERVQKAYEALLSLLNRPLFRQGHWQLLNTGPLNEHNMSYRNILAWTWRDQDKAVLIAVNYSSNHSQAYVILSEEQQQWFSQKGEKNLQLRISDYFSEIDYQTSINDICRRGIFISLEPFAYHALFIT